MEVLANMLTFGNRPHNGLAHVTGMARHIADSLYTGDSIDKLQKLAEAFLFASILAIRIDILPQKGELLITQGHGLFNLMADGLGTAASFPAPHIGHDAVGAEIITAIHDRNPSGKAALANKGPLKFLRHDSKVIIDAFSAAMTSKVILQDGTEIVYMSRSQDKVHLRIFFLEVLAPFLGHAAGYT